MRTSLASSMNDTETDIGTPGPFQIVESDGCGNVDAPIETPQRKYDCSNYETCLELAAALNWDNFTCSSCNSSINESLLWRARQEVRKDKVAGTICENLPQIGVHNSNKEVTSNKQVTADKEITSDKVGTFEEHHVCVKPAPVAK